MQDFLNLENTDYYNNDSEPETHEYNAEEELGNGEKILIFMYRKSLVILMHLFVSSVFMFNVRAQ